MKGVDALIAAVRREPPPADPADDRYTRPCPACRRTVRYSRIVTEVTVLLDLKPTTRGSYYVDGPDGAVAEDPHGVIRGPKYRRHRCGLRRVDEQP